MRRLAISIGLLLCCQAALAPSVLRAAPARDSDGSNALAEFFFAQAHQLLRAAPDRDTGFAESLPLFRAAARLDPGEPRFSRAIADTLVSQGNHAAAIQALQDYLKLVPEDQFEELELIDQLLAQKQSADQKLKYLTYVLSLKQEIPGPVRSEAALRAARLLLNHLQTKAAIDMLEGARADDKFNLAVLRMLFDLTADKSTPVERVSSLLDMVAANPADIWAASHLAQGLADLGMVRESLNWFSRTDQICMSLQAFPPDFVRGAASELVVADVPKKALDLISGTPEVPGYLQQRPDDIDAWTIALAAAHLQSEEAPGNTTAQATYNTLCNQAENTLQNRLADVRKEAGATDALEHDIHAPVQPLPDLTGDIALLQQNDDLKQKYTAAVFRLGWFELLHKRNPTGAKPLIDALAALGVPDNDARLLRLRGWQLYVSGDNDSALADFANPVVADDSMCRLGSALISLADPNGGSAGIRAAVSLLSKFPSGQVGATLASFLMVPAKNPPVVPTAAGAQNGLIEARLAQFDQVQADAIAPIFNIVNDPSQFYLIQVEPLETTFAYGEPILVKVTLTNTGGYPISIGENGILKNNINFDAGLRGIQSQGLAAIAVDRLGTSMLLTPNQANQAPVASIVRLDADFLYSTLQQSTDDIPLAFTVVTNPQGISTAPAQSISGVCGMRVPSTLLCERGPIPIDTPDQQAAFSAQLQSGDGGDRIRALAAAGLWLNKIHVTANPPAPWVTEGLQFPEAIRAALKDSADPVRAWAGYEQYIISTGGATVGAISDLAQQNLWESQLLVLLAAADADSSIWNIAANHPGADPIVADFARAVANRRALPPAAPTNPSAPTPPPSPTGN